MQKTTYYDNSGLFGGYSYPKSDSYSYSSTHQPYSTSNIENDFQSPVCPIQTSTIRPSTHKSTDVNGSCMRTSNGQGNSQAASIGEQQQAPPLPASSPNSNSTSSQKKKSPSNSASSTANSVITKQIFPWMKECRQNSKQKNNNCTTAGETCDDKSPPGPASKRQKRYPGSEYEHHSMQGNGGFANANLQGSPVYVGGNFVDSMPASGPMFNLGHLPHPSSASVDYSCAAQIPGNHHHGPCDPHPTYTDLTSHHASQGRIQEAPKLTHL
ncbi:hypothetical protein ANANG_G00064350 [Anguilla anguilla]|uniref:DUF4074 domain-containing protein n=1 Tax=Anguilla anguilla TaxID=7936 RepID=A0A9D3MPJ4_ANGAN|nr:hypothetical protein ANANG_G00064350 [Anguilla anguilla]